MEIFYKNIAYLVNVEAAAHTHDNHKEALSFSPSSRKYIELTFRESAKKGQIYDLVSERVEP